MLMGPPPGGYSPAAMTMGGQNTQMMGGQQNNNPQMIRMLMNMAGKGGFAHPGMGSGPSLGPVQQGPMGAAVKPMGM